MKINKHLSLRSNLMQLLLDHEYRKKLFAHIMIATEKNNNDTQIAFKRYNFLLKPKEELTSSKLHILNCIIKGIIKTGYIGYNKIDISKILDEKIFKTLVETFCDIQDASKLNKSECTLIIYSQIDKDDLINRINELTYITNKKIDFDSMFVNFARYKISIPYHIIKHILSFAKKDKDLLDTVGCLNEKFYLITLSCWQKITIDRHNVFRIPTLILKNVSHVNIKAYKFSKSKVYYLNNNLHNLNTLTVRGPGISNYFEHHNKISKHCKKIILSIMALCSYELLRDKVDVVEKSIKIRKCNFPNVKTLTAMTPTTIVWNSFNFENSIITQIETLNLKLGIKQPSIKSLWSILPFFKALKKLNLKNCFINLIKFLPENNSIQEIKLLIQGYYSQLSHLLMDDFKLIKPINLTKLDINIFYIGHITYSNSANRVETPCQLLENYINMFSNYKNNFLYDIGFLKKLTNFNLKIRYDIKTMYECSYTNNSDIRTQLLDLLDTHKEKVKFEQCFSFLLKLINHCLTDFNFVVDVYLNSEPNNMNDLIKKVRNCILPKEKAFLIFSRHYNVKNLVHLPSKNNIKDFLGKSLCSINACYSFKRNN